MSILEKLLKTKPKEQGKITLAQDFKVTTKETGETKRENNAEQLAIRLAEINKRLAELDTAIESMSESKPGGEIRKILDREFDLNSALSPVLILLTQIGKWNIGIGLTPSKPQKTRLGH